MLRPYRVGEIATLGNCSVAYKGLKVEIVEGLRFRSVLYRNGSRERGMYYRVVMVDRPYDVDNQHYCSYWQLYDQPEPSSRTKSTWAVGSWRPCARYLRSIGSGE